MIVRAVPLVALALALAAIARAADPNTPAAAPDAVAQALALDDPRALIERVEDVMRGDSSEIRAAMQITTPRWTRALRFHSWDDGANDRSFTRILDPKKDRGTGFLRIEGTFWTYLPRVERTMRIPPSMMLQPWMGSDLTNDDLARESSMLDDYEAKLIGRDTIDGTDAVGVELIPHEQAPVVWGRVEVWIDVARLAPLVQHYDDEVTPGRFERVRSIEFRDIRMVGSRPVPHLWRVVPADKPGHQTEITLESIAFDQPLDPQVFTQKNLRNPEGER